MSKFMKNFKNLRKQDLLKYYESLKCRSLVGVTNKDISTLQDNTFKDTSLNTHTILNNSQKEIPSTPSILRGRIKAIRKSGKIFFITLYSEPLNLIFKKEILPDFEDLKNVLAIGDICSFDGYVSKNLRGQDAFYVTRADLLTPCFRQIPLELKDSEAKIRDPVMNMIVNPEYLEFLKTRSRLISNLRNYLNARGFMEMETPVLGLKAGGAIASPFKTRLNSLTRSCFLRIAPELHLKKLIVAGMDKVYEIGKQFRNEGIDSTHYPEFTTCEFYEAYGKFEDLYTTTQHLLKEIIAKSTSSPIILKNNQELDLDTPFKRIEIVPFLNDHFGKEFASLDLNSTTSIPALVDLCHKHKIPYSEPTLVTLLDSIISTTLEPLCIQPTYLIGHPSVLSPLSINQNGISSRFELFINSTEFINAYQECNEADTQRQQFGHDSDEDYCSVLDIGLPPTIGWGLGIDRLGMLVTGQKQIRDLIAFPIVPPK